MRHLMSPLDLSVDYLRWQLILKKILRNTHMPVREKNLLLASMNQVPEQD